jgi:thiol-disulfide isomerase/thioredoxin
VLFFLTGYDLWLHKINYESYSGRVNETINEYSLVDIDGRPLLVDSLKGRVAVMDFWNTACEPCFKKFPIFKYKQSDYASKKANILFFTVNCPLQTDSRGLAQSMLQSRGYNFKQYYLQNKGDLENFKISYLPTVVILADGKRIIYRGDIEGVDDILNQFLKK